MRKKILSLLLLSCLSVPQAVSAQTATTAMNDNAPVVKQQVVETDKSSNNVVARSSEIGVATANLHIRKGAGLSYSIITTIAKGTSVSISDSMGDKYKDGYWWVYITVLNGTKKNTKGWAAVKYLRIDA